MQCIKPNKEINTSQVNVSDPSLYLVNALKGNPKFEQQKEERHKKQSLKTDLSGKTGWVDFNWNCCKALQTQLQNVLGAFKCCKYQPCLSQVCTQFKCAEPIYRLISPG